MLADDLSAEGAQLAEQGSCKARVWAALLLKAQGNGPGVKDLPQAVGEDSTKFGRATRFKSQWLESGER
jgi:hypothetical protein